MMRAAGKQYEEKKEGEGKERKNSQQKAISSRQRPVTNGP